MRQCRIILFLFTIIIFKVDIGLADQYVFDPSNSTIKGSISYAAIGQYVAGFGKYKGVLEYDPKEGVINSVTLTIDLASIKSNCAVCDDIVRSKRLMDVQQFPNITFINKKISKSDQQFVVDSFLEMHGVKKTVRFPFSVEKKDQILKVSGKWSIPRKEYGITWNKLLDHGGVFVGNYVNVEWQVEILPTKENGVL